MKVRKMHHWRRLAPRLFPRCVSLGYLRDPDSGRWVLIEVSRVAHQ